MKPPPGFYGGFDNSFKKSAAEPRMTHVSFMPSFWFVVTWKLISRVRSNVQHVHLWFFKDRNLFIKHKLQEKKPLKKSQFLKKKDVRPFHKPWILFLVFAFFKVSFTMVNETFPT